MALYLTVLLALLNQIGLKGSRMLVVLYAIDFHTSPFAIGMLSSMYAFFPLVLAVYAGRISDRIGVRIPMVLGSIGMGASLLLPTMLPFLPVLYVSAALVGISNIFFHVSAHNLVGSLGDADARTNNFGTFSLGSAISGFIGPMLVGFMVDHAGYSLAYYWLAAIAVVPGIFLLFHAGFIPAHVKIKHEKQASGIKKMLGNRALRGTLITSGLILTGIDLFNFYMPIYGRSIGLTASVIGVIIGMQAAAAFAVRLWMPRLSRLHGEKRVLTWSLLMAGVTYFLFPVFEHPVILAAISFLLGLGLGCGQPLSIILTYNHSPPGQAGEALGMRLTVNKLTQIAVPLVFGSLGTAFGIYPIFWSNAVFLLIGGYINAQPDER
ncbi:MAG: transporter [Herminiimonas sp.]|jgi:MFS family permease|nr:transporter [Herminiimonas sp.]